MSGYLDKLPSELIDYIYLLVHKMNTLRLNVLFKCVINKAKYYHIFQVWGPSNKLSSTANDWNIRFLNDLLCDLEYTKCCFKGPKKLRYFI
jgi:hypothetical protein